MIRRIRILFAVLTLALAVPLAAEARPLKKLTESDIHKLVELQIRDDAVIERIGKTGVDFKVDEDVLRRLKRAGASEAVLAALQGKKPGEGSSADAGTAAAPAAKGSLALWAEQGYSWDTTLHTDISINGQHVDTITSKTTKAIDGLIKPGWNTITLKSKAVAPAKSLNGITFRIGPVHRDPDSRRVTMEPVVWNFDTTTDWKHVGDRLIHKSNPEAKEVTCTFKVFYAGEEADRTPIKNGDYVLMANQGYSSWNPTATVTVYVNGTPLTSFLGSSRSQVPITKLLKKGKNEIKVVTEAVEGVIAENNFDLKVAGPAEYSASQGRFLVGTVIQCKTLNDWVQDKKTGRWHPEGKPGETSSERVLTFNLDEAPMAK